MFTCIFKTLSFMRIWGLYVERKYVRGHNVFFFLFSWSHLVFSLQGLIYLTSFDNILLLCSYHSLLRTFHPVITLLTDLLLLFSLTVKYRLWYILVQHLLQNDTTLWWKDLFNHLKTPEQPVLIWKHLICIDWFIDLMQ